MALERMSAKQDPSLPAQPRKKRETVAFVEGLRPGSTIRKVPLGEIDTTDKRFQIRLQATVGDLRKSLQSDGQQVPIVLWGKAAPWKIVDGFRRVEAVAALGWPSVTAVIRDDLDETEAFALAFLENARRKNLSTWDKASAIWQAIHLRKMSKAEAAEQLGVSKRQVERYLELMDLAEPLRAAVKGGKITLAHAAVLHCCKVKDLEEWIGKIVGDPDLSSRRLKRTLKALGRCGRPRQYIKADRNGFRLFPMRFSKEMDEDERRKIRDTLEKALRMVKAAK